MTSDPFVLPLPPGPPNDEGFATRCELCHEPLATGATERPCAGCGKRMGPCCIGDEDHIEAREQYVDADATITVEGERVEYWCKECTRDMAHESLIAAGDGLRVVTADRPLREGELLGLLKDSIERAQR